MAFSTSTTDASDLLGKVNHIVRSPSGALTMTLTVWTFLVSMIEKGGGGASDNLFVDETEIDELKRLIALEVVRVNSLFSSSSEDSTWFLKLSEERDLFRSAKETAVSRVIALRRRAIVPCGGTQKEWGQGH